MALYGLRGFAFYLECCGRWSWFAFLVHACWMLGACVPSTFSLVHSSSCLLRRHLIWFFAWRSSVCSSLPALRFFREWLFVAWVLILLATPSTTFTRIIWWELTTFIYTSLKIIVGYYWLTYKHTYFSIRTIISYIPLHSMQSLNWDR